VQDCRKVVAAVLAELGLGDTALGIELPFLVVSIDVATVFNFQDEEMVRFRPNHVKSLDISGRSLGGRSLALSGGSLGGRSLGGRSLALSGLTVFLTSQIMVFLAQSRRDFFVNETT
jgi:hypothetical protein